jgi:hypothetical protein
MSADILARSLRARVAALAVALGLFTLCLGAERVIAQAPELPVQGLVAHYAMAGSAVDFPRWGFKPLALAGQL